MKKKGFEKAETKYDEHKKVCSLLRGFSKNVIDKWTGYINEYLYKNNPKLKAIENYEKHCIDIYEIEEEFLCQSKLNLG